MGGFVVSGRKIWTSKALESEVVLLLARTDDVPEGAAGRRAGGFSLFLAELIRSTSTFDRFLSWVEMRLPHVRWPMTNFQLKVGVSRRTRPWLPAHSSWA